MNEIHFTRSFMGILYGAVFKVFSVIGLYVFIFFLYTHCAQIIFGESVALSDWAVKYVVVPFILLTLLLPFLLDKIFNKNKVTSIVISSYGVKLICNKGSHCMSAAWQDIDKVEEEVDDESIYTYYTIYGVFHNSRNNSKKHYYRIINKHWKNADRQSFKAAFIQCCPDKEKLIFP